MRILIFLQNIYLFIYLLSNVHIVNKLHNLIHQKEAQHTADCNKLHLHRTTDKSGYIT